MVGRSVALPVEEHDVARLGLFAARSPQPGVLEPLHARGAVGELGDGARFDQPALVRAPADKASTPLHT